MQGEERAEFMATWRKVLSDEHLLAVQWPKEYGGAGLSAVEQVVVAEEFARAGVLSGADNDMLGINLLGNTLIVWGTEKQKEHFLPRILTADDKWCQGFSEPGAGSDLAGLRTSAVLEGDEWVINGSKIWTSGGHLADWIFVLVRTDPDAEKHKGITMLLVPMHQPGIEVRPIVNMAGDHSFNQVFFTNARTAAENVVGQANNGWKVTMTLLGFERGAGATTDAIRSQNDVDRLLALAKERGKNDDPHIRELLAWCYGRVELIRYRGYQTLTRFLKGQNPGPDAAFAKLLWSEFAQRYNELAVEILGMDALTPSGPGRGGSLASPDIGAPNSSRAWVDALLTSRAGTIAAGSSQVQRNIIGEQLLGLPKEPRMDGGPFRQLVNG
ncbi:MAG: acyl-CoA dehydrogenase family protein [Microbacteriaceae bacterium]